MSQLSISLASETVATVGGFEIRNTLLMSWLAMVVLLGIVALITAAGTSVNGSRTLQSTLNFCADAGMSDAYACNMTPALQGYVAGACYTFKANTANTGAATIAFNGLTATTIVKVTGGITTALADNDIRAGQYVSICYDGTNMEMQSTLGNAASAGATPAGTATEINARLNGTTFAAIQGTSTLPTAGWSNINFGGNAYWNDFSQNDMVLSIQDVGSSISYKLVTRSVPDATFTTIAKISCTGMAEALSASRTCGFYLSDGTKIEGMEVISLSGATEGVRFITNATVTSTPTVVTATTAPVSQDVTIKIVEDGTHTTWSYWDSGSFHQYVQRNTNTFLTPSTNGPGGVTVLNNGADIDVIHLTYFCYSAATTTCNGL